MIWFFVSIAFSLLAWGSSPLDIFEGHTASKTDSDVFGQVDASGAT